MSLIRELVRSVARRKTETAWVVGVLGLALALSAVLGALAGSALAPRWSAGSGSAVRFVESRTPVGTMGVSLRDVERIQPRLGADPVAVTRPERASLRVGSRVYPAAGEAVSADYFRLLEAVPLAGRLLGPADDVPAPDTVVISSRLAIAIYGGAGEAIGERIALQLAGFMGSYEDDRLSLQVVGVLPEQFRGTLDPWQRADYWIPIGIRHGGRSMPNGRDMYVRLFGLFGKSRWLEQETSRILDTLASEEPPTGAGFAGGAARFGLARTPPTRLPSLLGSATPNSLGLPLLLVAACVLAIAAMNIIGLARCQLYYRHAEIQLRALLGATRAQLTLLLCAEQAIKGLLAIGVGMVLALAIFDLLQHVTPTEIGGWRYAVRELRLDATSEWGVFELVALVGAVVVVVLCALRAFDVARAHVGAGARPRPRVPAVVAYGVLLPQIAVSAAASVVSAAIVGGVIHQETQILGYSPAELFVVEFELPATPQDSAHPPQVDRRTLNARMLERVLQVPGIRGASLSSGLPFTPMGTFVAVPERGPAPRARRVSEFVVSEQFFDVMGIGVSGRAFDDLTNAATTPVCIVSRSLARALWTDADPIGRTLGFTGPRGGPVLNTCEVVGRADDVYAADVPGRPTEAVYRPLAQQVVPRATTAVVSGPVASPDFRRAVQEAISGTDVRVNVSRARSVQDALGEIKYPRRLVLGATLLIAGVGWVFTVVGLFALLSLAALHQEREFAIRSALGAPRRSIAWALLRTGFVVAGLGWCIGGWCGWAALELMEQRFEVTPDVGVVSIAAGLLATMATVAAAAWIPLRRVCGLAVAQTLRSV